MAETLTLDGAIAAANVGHDRASGMLRGIEACVCGKRKFGEPGWHHRHHAAHLADAVRAWLLGQREVVAAAVDVVLNGCGSDYPLVNPAACYDEADAVLAALTKADQ